MCGIVGYVGKKKCKQIILDGLSRLEYRGYDSAGIVCIDQQHKHLSFTKEVGNISSLKEKLANDTHDGCIGVGHTRWATHGEASQENAHPQFNCTNTIAVVHNGIIENHHDIRSKILGSGYEYKSTTDTEVAAHLLEKILERKSDIKDAAIELVKQLKGIYGLVFLLEQHNDTLLLIRHKSPLAVGIGKEEMFVASDPIAFSDKTNKTLFLPESSFALLSSDSIKIYDFQGNELNIAPQSLDIKFTTANKQGFDHYMLKEIYEQKKAIDNTISFYKRIGDHVNVTTCDPSSAQYTHSIWGQLGLCCSDVRKLKHIQMVAAGTSWHAGKIAQFFFEEICDIPTNVFLASEFRYKKFFPKENSLSIAISQSGETADTLECLRHLIAHEQTTAALTNVASSTMIREAGGFLLMQAGPEISVASTKAFTSQIASLYWLANRVALERGTITPEQMQTAEDDLYITAEILESTIENYKWEIKQTLAPKYAKYEKFIFLGRHISYPFALEAALKLKEISYCPAHAYPAGELKHGPIALVDQSTPIVIFSVLDELIYQKILANAQEVKARHGHLIAFAFEGQQELIDLADTVFVIPQCNPLLAPLTMAGIMQFFIYNISNELGLPIDKPRNLAKSVTVE